MGSTIYRRIEELQIHSQNIESKITNVLTDLSVIINDLSLKKTDEILNQKTEINSLIQTIVNTWEEKNGTDWRLQTIRDFSNWLFEFTIKSAQTSLIPDEELTAPDLYTVFEHFISLKQEIREQTKVVKSSNTRAQENMIIAKEALEKQETTLNDTVIQTRSLIAEAKKEGEERVILDFIKVRDMIKENISYENEKNEKQNGLFNKINNTETLKIHKNLLTKIDDIFRRLYVFPYTKKGDLFDSKTMRAVSTAYDPQKEIGSVLKIFRQGYKKENKILQIAEVEICKEE